MVSRETIVQAIVDRVEVTRKIRVTYEGGVVNIINQILDKIEIINATSEFASMLWGKPLTEILVADEWKDLITPASVRIDPTDLKTANLLVKPEVIPSSDVSDYIDWINAQLAFRQLFKKDLSSEVTTLDKLRQPKALFDVLPIATFGKSSDDNDPEAPASVRSVDEPFIPIRLKPEVKALFREDYCNTNCYQIISDYYAKFLI